MGRILFRKSEKQILATMKEYQALGGSELESAVKMELEDDLALAYGLLSRA